MDGNGRWAKERGLPRAEGHKRGSQTIEKIVEVCQEIGIHYLTLYAFSEENWNRPREEVSALMDLLYTYLAAKKHRMIEKGIRFRVIGDFEMLSPKLRGEITSTMNATKDGSKMTLIVALSYGSRQEICRAVNRLLTSGAREVTQDDLSRALDTADIPDPDLLIRTSGERRISNFLLWQLAYTELYFTDVLWPDFNHEEIVKAIEEYQRRERRFGLISEQL
jgi:undecaprenyl diphosphate synthase